MRAFFLSLALAGTLLAQSPTPSPTPERLEAVVLRSDLWKGTGYSMRDDLERLGFRWVSEKKDALRSVSENTLADVVAKETLIRMENDTPTEIVVFFLQRGVPPELDEASFQSLIERLRKDLTALLGGEPSTRGDAKGAIVDTEGLAWERDGTEYVLDWSFTKNPRAKTPQFRFTGEFIRLVIRPKAERPAIGATVEGNREAIKKFVGAEHVKTGEWGVRLEGVPMVDQGTKGYCVVASVERVLRFYGATVDQYELAQIASSDAARGTELGSMLDSMKRLTGRLGVRTKTVYDMEPRDFSDMIEDYNRLAKRERVPPVLDARDIPIDQLYARMDPFVLLQTKAKQRSAYGKFIRAIKSSIDGGTPVLWAVMLGIAQEKNAVQPTGGHMRLIIGYDEARKHIIYSDSWGAGHEEKRISMEDAWAITTGVFVVEPTGK